MNKALAQITDLFRSMTPGARIIAALLLAVVVISVAYLFNSSVSGPDTFLLGGRAFTDNEMGRIQVAFGEANLSNWEAVGMQIRIPRAQQAQYLAALAKGNALPQDFRESFTQMVQDSNPFTSERQRQTSLDVAETNLLTQIIEAMPNIDRANVMIKEDKAGGLGGARSRRTANVVVFPRSGYELTAEDAKSFREIVSGGRNIDARQISVVDGSTNSVMASVGRETVGAGGNELLLAKRAWERLYREKIQESLSMVNGAVVTAEVKVKPEARSRSTELVVDKKNRTESQISEQTSDSNSQSGGPGGRPGFESNSPVPNGFAAANANMSTQTSTTDSTANTQTSFVIPFTETTTEMSGFEAEQVQVAVSVPETHFIEIWRQLNPTPAGGAPVEPTAADLATVAADEIKKIKAQVAGLLPPELPGAAVTERVTVNRFAPLPAQEPPAVSFLDNATSWLSQSWSTVAMFMLAGFGLMTLRGITKGIPSGEPAAAQNAAPALAIAPETMDDAPSSEPGGKPAVAPRLKRRATGGPSLREELSEIVKEDPDAAANVLRAWIGSAS